MKKKAYEKPSFRVVELQHKCQILSDSEDPKRNVPWWDGEAGARKHNGVWDGEGDSEEE